MSTAMRTRDYVYDDAGNLLSVGSARITSANLDGKATNTVTTWEYDDRYRLVNETVEVDDPARSLSKSTDYTWDSADKRLSKTVFDGDEGTNSAISDAYNPLKQMTGYNEEQGGIEDWSVVSFAYDYRSRRYHRSTPIAEFIRSKIETTINQRAVCGRTARTVRRGGATQCAVPTPINIWCCHRPRLPLLFRKSQFG